MPDTSIIATRWLEAFNAHDLERLLLLYTEDAVHYSPKLKIRQPRTHGLISGKTALKSWWQEALERLPTLQYSLVALTAGNERVFMEYTRQVAGEPDLHVAEVLEIANGLITASRVYHG